MTDQPTIERTWLYGPDMAIVTDPDAWVVNAKGERIARVGVLVPMCDAAELAETPA